MHELYSDATPAKKEGGSSPEENRMIFPVQRRRLPHPLDSFSPPCGEFDRAGNYERRRRVCAGL